MLQLSVWGVSTTLQTSNSMFGGIYSLVRLIFAAEEQLFTLVLFPPLQVCYTLFSTLNTVLFPPLQSPWVPVTQGSLLSRIITLTHFTSLSNASETRDLVNAHLCTAEHHTFHLHSFNRRWPGTPKNKELRSLELEQYMPNPLDLATADPKATMWGKIHANYRPNPRPSSVACDPPSDNIPPPAI